MLSDSVGRKFSFPSLSYLSKFWQDSFIDVQQASRCLFTSALCKMSLGKKKSLIDFWKIYLPTVYHPVRMGKANIRATLILGIVGSEEPQSMSQMCALCKDVSESLVLLLNEGYTTPYPASSVELLGLGFSLWEAHVNGAAIVRRLVSLTGLAVNEVSQSRISNSLTPIVMLAARQAIANVASTNAALVISTLSFDLIHAKTDGERSGCLKLIGMFFGKKNVLLFPYLPRIVEAMVKVLDPNTPDVRDSLLPIVTVNFAELVRSYPNINFHSPSQRLAIGTMEGTIFIFDLRTATKVLILEGHTHSVSAVSVSNDGKLIASYSVQENSLKFWQLHTGFLGSLVGAFGTNTGGNPANAVLGSLGGGRAKPYRSFNVGPPQNDSTLEECLEIVALQWVSERGARLKSINGIDLVFTV